ncbi:hypothetical protein [Burkholderia sp. S-53]|uniref:hypothetical protein n=1 Tax=Burkholderia sp. S-53 TaxID=2906514 RepID=UPI00399A12DC
MQFASICVRRIRTYAFSYVLTTAGGPSSALAFANGLDRLLIRIKAGPQATPAMVRRASLLLAQMIRTPGRFTGITRDERRDQRAGHAVERATVDIVERFAIRLLDEWVNDQCVECGARGRALCTRCDAGRGTMQRVRGHHEGRHV